MSPIAVERAAVEPTRIIATPARIAAANGPGLGLREPAIIFTTALAFYALVGLYTIVGLEIVVGDAQARLAHAYFVWWNEPPKLAAIGFYWPPLQTIVLLPLALVKPLATSMAALALTSALFGAGLVVVVDRTLAFFGVERALRWAIVAAFALNPMILYYAANGMAEIVYLFFLALGFWLFLRWTVSPRWHDLLLAGIAFALAVITRYELAAWLPLVLAGVIGILVARRASVPTIEACLLALLVPVLYGMLLWVYMNGTITGQPLGFLTATFPTEVSPDPSFDDPLTAFLETAYVHAALFPAAFVVAAVLVVVAIGRRSWTATILAASILVGPLITLFLMLRSGQGFLLELRYNMREMPIAVLAGGWLAWAAGRRWRRPAAAALLAALVASIPATTATMLTYDDRLNERITGARVRPASGAEQFVRGVLLGDRDVERLVGSGSLIDDQRAVVDWISRNVDGRDAILTDEATTFGVMLLDGRPDRYFDRVDRGDDQWLRAHDDPVGRVDYLLVNKATFLYDLVNVRYPSLVSGQRPPPYLERVYDNPSFSVYRVRTPQPPRR